MGRREILVIDRGSTGAHPSYASGGFIVLAPGATGYRNADLVPRQPAEILAWCRGAGCVVTELPDEGARARRYHIRFPTDDALASFEHRFLPKGRQKAG